MLTLTIQGAPQPNMKQLLTFEELTDKRLDPDLIVALRTELDIGQIKYVFNITPCPAPRMTRSDKWKLDPFHKDPKKRQRPCVTRYFAFRDKFTKECKKLKYELEERLDIVFVIEMPKSWSGKKKNEMLYRKHQSRPDRDNLLKAVQDSFKKDDGFVFDGRTTKIWGYEPMIIIYKMSDLEKIKENIELAHENAMSQYNEIINQVNDLKDSPQKDFLLRTLLERKEQAVSRYNELIKKYGE